MVFLCPPSRTSAAPEPEIIFKYCSTSFVRTYTWIKCQLLGGGSRDQTFIFPVKLAHFKTHFRQCEQIVFSPHLSLYCQRKDPKKDTFPPHVISRRQPLRQIVGLPFTHQSAFASIRSIWSAGHFSSNYSPIWSDIINIG